MEGTGRIKNCVSVLIVLYLLMSFSILTWNVRGILHNTTGIRRIIPDYVDVLAIQEHWLTTDSNTELLSDFKAINYLCAHNSSSPRGHGGIALLCNNHSKWSSVPIRTVSENFTTAQFSCSGYSDVYVIACRLPSTNVLHSVYLDALAELIDHYDVLCEKGDTYIVGDLNADVTKNVLSPRDNSIRQMIQQRHFHHAIRDTRTSGPGFTYRSKDHKYCSLIDYILVPSYMENYITDCHVIECSYDVSDHYACLVSLQFSQATEAYSSTDCYVRWQKADVCDLTLYNNEVSRLLSSVYVPCDNITHETVELHNTLVTQCLHTAAFDCIPQGTYRPYLKPYWKKSNLNDLHFQMRNTRRQWVSDSKPRGNSSDTYVAYKDSKREFRRVHRQAKRAKKRDVLKELEQSAEVDINTFYKTVRKQRRQKTQIDQLEYCNECESTASGICRLWGNYFSDLAQPFQSHHFDEAFKNEVSSKLENYCNMPHDMAGVDLVDAPFTISEVQGEIKLLKKNKSPGPDYIRNEHIMFAGDSLALHLALLFNNMRKLHYVPYNHRLGMVISIYKGKKSKSDPRNYRGITLTSCISKLFEKLLLNRLTKWVREYKPDFPDAFQFGFREEHGAIMSVYTLLESIQQYFNNDSCVFAAFLDNEKAFDRIWHDGLFCKLYEFGITGSLWKLIKHSYSKSFAFVSYRGETSNVYPVKQGVGQGRVLSAWFFLLYINDLITTLRTANTGIRVFGQNVPAILLADDTTLVSASPRALQTALDFVHIYASKWRLSYNASKSNCIVFSKSKTSVIDLKCSFGHMPIQSAQSVTYGGILLSHNLSCKPQLDKNCRKARQSINSLRPLGVNSTDLHPAVSVKIWQRIVLKTSFYGCELLTGVRGKDIDMLENTQRYFARIVQGFDKRSSRECTIANLGLFTMMGYIHKCKLQFLGRLFRIRCGTSPKHIFCAIISKSAHQSKSTTGDLLTILNMYNLENHLSLYLKCGVFPDKSTWQNIVSKAIQTREEQQWAHNVSVDLSLSRYLSVHSKLTLHTFWLIAFECPKIRTKCQLCVKIASRPKQSLECTLCQKHASDYDKHIIMHCESLLSQRNQFFSTLIDSLDVNTYVDFEMQEEDDMLSFMLGGSPPFDLSITAHTRLTIRTSFAAYLYTLKPYLDMYHF